MPLLRKESEIHPENIFEIGLPWWVAHMRSRREKALVRHLAERGIPPRSFTQAALALIGALTWPGNVRELRDAIDRVLVDRSGSDDIAAAADTDAVQVEHLLPALRLQRAGTAFTPAGSRRQARTRFERDYIASVLQHHDWHMANAAQTLCIQRPNLYRKARQLDLEI